MKAILVIDMPESCYECQFQGMGGRDLELLTCSLNRWRVDNPNERPSWCPLKPIVFCEECKYADELGEWSKYDYSCRHFNTHSVNKGNFCSYGEKQNEQDE